MTPQQSELLAGIQALAIAAREQTGIPTAYSSYSTLIDDHPLIINASVTIMPAGAAPWSMKGTTYRLRDPGENDLAGLRDELAQWVASNRKQEAA
ncbi:hypothetical protein HPA02_34900 [Bisbaumannia pacifica]|uniref:Uncharacterized protein n=1 Tax=Bisbaumannia pacifica TaxID=77098 RepID=A0A510XES0_9GAMM|nr:hypothetical protein [Halomonas pacifica]GEK49207.1 hypothetical protein HPA02_34900 [Halomonas pacifica]